MTQVALESRATSCLKTQQMLAWCQQLVARKGDLWLAQGFMERPNPWSPLGFTISPFAIWEPVSFILVLLFITISISIVFLVQLTDDQPSWTTDRKFFHCLLFMIVLCHPCSTQQLTCPSPKNPSNLMADVQKVSIVFRLPSLHLQILLKYKFSKKMSTCYHVKPDMVTQEVFSC